MKNLVDIHVIVHLYVPKILRFALNDKAFFILIIIILSFRTERSAVKNLVDIHVIVHLYVPEILRFALNDIPFYFISLISYGVS